MMDASCEIIITTLLFFPQGIGIATENATESGRGSVLRRGAEDAQAQSQTHSSKSPRRKGEDEETFSVFRQTEHYFRLATSHG